MSASVHAINLTLIFILRDILSMTWAIQSNDVLMVVMSSLTTPTLAERLYCLSLFLAIVGTFTEALIPLGAERRSKWRQLDLSMNPKRNFQVGAYSNSRAQQLNSMRKR